MFGALLVVVEVCLALFAPILSAYEPNKMDYTALLSAPSAEHLLGTDELGRDIFTRMMYGARLSLTVGTMAVLLAIVLGVPFGLIAGYVGGYVDEILMRVVDSVMASWGNMVQVGFQFLEIAPWFALVPATAIFLAVLGFNMLGDGLRDALDPQSSS